MPLYLSTALIYGGAALAEIAGCFAFWAWLRMGRSVWWIAPGVACLILFAYLLTLAPTENAGRAYAAYGGIYIVGSLLWFRYKFVQNRHSPNHQAHTLLTIRQRDDCDCPIKSNHQSCL